MVDAGEEHVVGRDLHVCQGAGEVLVEPGERLGRCESLPGDVRGRRRELVDHRVRVRAPEHAEDLRLRDVCRRVQIEQIAGGAVRLLAHQRAALVRPARESLDEMLAQHLVERLPIVRLHARDVVIGAAPRERGKLVGEVVTAVRMEEREELGGSVARVLERIVEVRADRAARPRRRAIGEHAQISIGGVRREGIDRRACATGRGSFDVVAGEARAGDVHGPATGRRLPRRRARHGRWDAHASPVVGHGDDGVDAAPRRIALPAVPAAHRGHGDSERLVRVGRLHGGTADAPAASLWKIEPHPATPRLGRRVAHDVDPARREVRDVDRVCPLCTIDDRDLDPAESGRIERSDLAREVGFVDRAAEPPPARPRLRLARHGRPVEDRAGRRGLVRLPACGRREREHRADGSEQGSDSPTCERGARLAAMITRPAVLLALCLAGALACARTSRAPARGPEVVPDRLVVLTFDDAVKSHYTTVAPLLERYGFPATFFVTEFPQPPFSDTTLYMTWAQIGDLNRRGFEVANHTWRHTHVDQMDSARFTDELRYVEEKLRSLGAPTPVSFAYPAYVTSPEA